MITRSKVRETSGLLTFVGTKGQRSALMRSPSTGPEVIGVVGSYWKVLAYWKIAQERVVFSVEAHLTIVLFTNEKTYD